jgi:signal transduction histidine kinase
MAGHFAPEFVGIATARKPEARSDRIAGGGIAHDFNNILSGLLGFTELAKRDVAPTSKAHQYLEQIAQAGKRAAALVHHILAFSHLENHTKHPIFLHPIVKEAVALLRATVPASIEIHSHIDTHCPAVCADPPAFIRSS